MKHKSKFGTIWMVVLLLAAVFYLFMEERSIKISAAGLSRIYSQNKIQADEKFLAKKIELSGFVSANYLFTDSVSVLKLESDSGLNIFCLLPGYALNNKVHNYTVSSKVIVTGECIGIKDMFNLSGVFVKVFSLKSADR